MQRERLKGFQGRTKRLASQPNVYFLLKEVPKATSRKQRAIGVGEKPILMMMVWRWLDRLCKLPFPPFPSLPFSLLGERGRVKNLTRKDASQSVQRVPPYLMLLTRRIEMGRTDAAIPDPPAGAPKLAKGRGTKVQEKNIAIKKMERKGKKGGRPGGRRRIWPNEKE